MDWQTLLIIVIWLVTLWLSNIAGQLAGILNGMLFILRDPPKPGTSITIPEKIKMLFLKFDFEEFKIEYPTERADDEILDISKPKPRGRPRQILPPSAKQDYGFKNIDEYQTFVSEAKRAADRKDGSFAKMCRERTIPESTVRTWVENLKRE